MIRLKPESAIQSNPSALYAQGKARDRAGLDKAVAIARDWFVEQLAPRL